MRDIERGSSTLTLRLQSAERIIIKEIEFSSNREQIYVQKIRLLYMRVYLYLSLYLCILSTFSYLICLFKFSFFISVAHVYAFCQISCAIHFTVQIYNILSRDTAISRRKLQVFSAASLKSDIDVWKNTRVSRSNYFGLSHRLKSRWPR